MIIPLDDIFKIRGSVLHKQHIKQEPEQISGGIDQAPVPVDSSQAIEVNGISKIVVHPQWRMDRITGAHKRDR